MLLQEFPGSSLFTTMREMERIQNQLNKLFDAGAWRGEYPPLNIWTSEESAVITAEIPGVAPEDIDISVVNETLTIKGERKPEPIGESETLHRREREFGHFVRSVQLPFRVDQDKVEASFKQGVLRISLPRAEQDKPRKISVIGQ